MQALNTHSQSQLQLVLDEMKRWMDEGIVLAEAECYERATERFERAATCLNGFLKVQQQQEEEQPTPCVNVGVHSVELFLWSPYFRCSCNTTNQGFTMPFLRHPLSVGRLLPVENNTSSDPKEQSITQEELSAFAATLIFNLGLCNHLQYNKSSASASLDRTQLLRTASRMYQLAWETINHHKEEARVNPSDRSSSTPYSPSSSSFHSCSLNRILSMAIALNWVDALTELSQLKKAQRIRTLLAQLLAECQQQQQQQLHGKLLQHQSSTRMKDYLMEASRFVLLLSNSAAASA